VIRPFVTGRSPILLATILIVPSPEDGKLAGHVLDVSSHQPDGSAIADAVPTAQTSKTTTARTPVRRFMYVRLLWIISLIPF
jgi:hypothetical protein